MEPSWNPGGTLVEPSWNLTSGPPRPPRSLSGLRPQSFQLLGKNTIGGSVFGLVDTSQCRFAMISCRGGGVMGVLFWAGCQHHLTCDHDATTIATTTTHRQHYLPNSCFRPPAFLTSFGSHGRTNQICSASACATCQGLLGVGRPTEHVRKVPAALRPNVQHRPNGASQQRLLRRIG